MITLSHDPEAGTLYWYFQELEEGAIQIEGEADAVLLLDVEGMIVGAQLELDESVRPEDLGLALAQPGVRYDAETFVLTVMLFAEEPAEEQPMDEPAILDFDAAERLLGFEILPARTFSLATRLERLGDRLVEPEVVEEDEPDRTEELIAEWVARQDPVDSRHETADKRQETADEDQAAPQSAARDGSAPAALADPAAPTMGALADLEDDQDAQTPLAENATALTENVAPVVPTPTDAQPANFRSGFVAIVGKPNVGKSTLLNALLGQKVAIVSPKPQTTRVPMRGILNRPDSQVIFIDTPGIHDPRSKLGGFMVDLARQAIPDADVVCFMVDITRPPAQLDRKIAALVGRARAPRLLVLNKLDATNKQTRDYLQQYRDLGSWDMEIAVSARTGEGLPALVDELVQRLPLGPRLYPEDQVSDQSERELAAELVREKVLHFTEQEVPHSVAVEVEEWEQRDDVTYIRMTVYTEKDSQKSILIGAGGTMLKRIGTAARADIERVVGRPVFLDLWVKTRANWRDDPAALHWLGYSSRDKR